MEISSEEAGVNDQTGNSGEAHARLVVLVVDDEEDIRGLLRLILSRAGYDVQEAGDGESALAFLQNDLPDLILLDLLMPGIDGFEVCRRVRAGQRTKAIPILILSAMTDSHSRQEGLRAGATKYLTKPLTATQLLEHVGDALDPGP